MPITTNQTRYRFRSDTLTVDSASVVWPVAENTTWAPSPERGTPFRLRFEVQNSGNTTTGATTWELFVSRNAGAYAQVTTGGTFVQASSAASTDADDTALATRRLTADAGTFVNGRYDETGQIASGLVTLTATTVTELEFGLVFTNSIVAPDTYDFRVYRAGVALNGTYSQTPRVTIATTVAQGQAGGTGAVTADGTGIVIAIADADGFGAAAAEGSGTNFVSANGAAIGAGTASATGVSFFIGVGASSGTGIATATGRAAALVQGAGSGSGSATATGRATFIAQASATATGTASAIGSATGTAQGSATGAGTGAGVSIAPIVAKGVAVGSGVANATGKTIITGVGVAAGHGDATAAGSGIFGARSAINWHCMTGQNDNVILAGRRQKKPDWIAQL